MHIVKVISGYSGFLVHRFHRSLYSQSPLPAPSVSDGGHNAPIRTSNLEGWCVCGGGGASTLPEDKTVANWQMTTSDLPHVPFPSLDHLCFRRLLATSRQFPYRAGVSFAWDRQDGGQWKKCWVRVPRWAWVWHVVLHTCHTSRFTPGPDLWSPPPCDYTLTTIEVIGGGQTFLDK